MIKRPTVTTIIPVYNVEAYLRGTLDSVITQDIGFANNIEIILIDDGSTDESGAICVEYYERYPDNILYIKQKNAGVSAARNRALDRARGEYIHFLDSDDLIASDAYSKAIRLLDSAKAQIDFAALRIEFFDRRLGEHPLNYKFTTDRVIDVNERPDAVIIHMPTCIIRRKAIRSSFDSEIKISEDMKFITEILFEKKKYGLIASSRYYYRKRKSGNSAIDSARKGLTFYTITPQRVYKEMLRQWTISGMIHPYAQHVVMYDLQWRLIQKKQAILPQKEEKRYKNVIKSLICQIDDDVILSQRFVDEAYLLYALRVKYGAPPKEVLEKFRQRIRNLEPEVVLQFISRGNESTVIEGYIQKNPLADRIEASTNGKNYELPAATNKYAGLYFLDDVVDSRTPFRLEVANSEIGDSMSFHVKGGTTKLSLLPRRFSRLSLPKFSYGIFGDRIFINRQAAIEIREYTLSLHFVCELRWMFRILFALRLRESAKRLHSILRSSAKKTISLKKYIYPFALPFVMLLRNLFTIWYRLSYYVIQPFLKKPIWIFSDRTNAAGDSAEVLYKYAAQQEDNTAGMYFAISQKSPDYRRLKDEGVRVIDTGSFWYKVIFLHAAKIISSHADDYVINPFTYRLDQVNDLYTFDFVFLQHGVIRNDLSELLNRYNKNIQLFVVSARAEYDSIFHYDYYYTHEQVLLSGLPRYDFLESKPQQKLIVAPTWRHWLAEELTEGERPYSANFKNSKYFKFYNSLINNKKLLGTLRKYAMIGEVYLHPSFEAQTRDFRQNDIFAIKNFPYDYQAVFREGSLMVSDYSSVIFDFIYLRKPIIYTQFDKDVFYMNHLYTAGYMDDAKDGFGPMTRTVDEAVEAIILSIETGCKLERKYSKRAEKFFAYHDRDNSKRVYEAIAAHGS